MVAPSLKSQVMFTGFLVLEIEFIYVYELFLEAQSNRVWLVIMDGMACCESMSPSHKKGMDGNMKSWLGAPTESPNWKTSVCCFQTKFLYSFREVWAFGSFTILVMIIDSRSHRSAFSSFHLYASVLFYSDSCKIIYNNNNNQSCKVIHFHIINNNQCIFLCYR